MIVQIGKCHPEHLLLAAEAAADADYPDVLMSGCHPDVLSLKTPPAMRAPAGRDSLLQKAFLSS